MLPMHVYRLVPIAPPDDPNWDRAINRGEIVVLARSSGEARAIAAIADSDTDNGIAKITTQVAASAVLDSKLYGLRHEGVAAESDRTGTARVLSGPTRLLYRNNHDD